MDSELPYLYIDDEYDFNVAILLLIIDKLALNSRKNYKLNFNKIQFFMYLIRNPSKMWRRYFTYNTKFILKASRLMLGGK